ncbi:hypothetical protein PR048_028548 [Dryococelus australis]|uniref:Uncharacterized protein n=1 Tax=Dryococelus australis TaxID=614101 RepID=A0ABQ9GAW4_9NEOP|nr:hypothetical protein PR048_028548 [Dryococelus australis]
MRPLVSGITVAWQCDVSEQEEALGHIPLTSEDRTYSMCSPWEAMQADIYRRDTDVGECGIPSDPMREQLVIGPVILQARELCPRLVQQIGRWLQCVEARYRAAKYGELVRRTHGARARKRRRPDNASSTNDVGALCPHGYVSVAARRSPLRRQVRIRLLSTPRAKPTGIGREQSMPDPSFRRYLLQSLPVTEAGTITRTRLLLDTLRYHFEWEKTRNHKIRPNNQLKGIIKGERTPKGIEEPVESCYFGTETECTIRYKPRSCSKARNQTRTKESAAQSVCWMHGAAGEVAERFGEVLSAGAWCLGGGLARRRTRTAAGDSLSLDLVIQHGEIGAVVLAGLVCLGPRRRPTLEGVVAAAQLDNLSRRSLLCNTRSPVNSASRHRLMKVNMERRRNEGAGGTGDPLENPPTSGIVRHDSHLGKSGNPTRQHKPRHWLLPQTYVVFVVIPATLNDATRVLKRNGAHKPLLLAASGFPRGTPLSPSFPSERIPTNNVSDRSEVNRTKPWRYPVDQEAECGYTWQHWAKADVVNGRSPPSQTNAKVRLQSCGTSSWSSLVPLTSSAAGDTDRHFFWPSLTERDLPTATGHRDSLPARSVAESTEINGNSSVKRYMHGHFMNGINAARLLPHGYSSRGRGDVYVKRAEKKRSAGHELVTYATEKVSADAKSNPLIWSSFDCFDFRVKDLKFSLHFNRYPLVHKSNGGASIRHCFSEMTRQEGKRIKFLLDAMQLCWGDALARPKARLMDVSDDGQVVPLLSADVVGGRPVRQLRVEDVLPSLELHSTTVHCNTGTITDTTVHSGLCGFTDVQGNAQMSTNQPTSEIWTEGAAMYRAAGRALTPTLRPTLRPFVDLCGVDYYRRLPRCHHRETLIDRSLPTSGDVLSQHHISTTRHRAGGAPFDSYRIQWQVSIQ